MDEPARDFTLGMSFFLALVVLPPPRLGKELLLRLIATLSPVTTLCSDRCRRAPENLSPCADGTNIKGAVLGLLVGEWLGDHSGVGDVSLFFRAEVANIVSNIPRGIAFGFFGAHLFANLFAKTANEAILLPGKARDIRGACSGDDRMVVLCGALARLRDPGCFFAGSNVGYRAIYLLFLLSGASDYRTLRS
jgi:hypothetical protein